MTNASILVFVPAHAILNVLIMKHNRDDTRISFRAPCTCMCPQAKCPNKINTNSEREIG